MNFNLSRLRYLYEVSLCGSMRAASEKMNVAPSSVSRQIAILEDELDAPVLERGRGKAKLTDAGAMAVEYYREDRARKETLASHLDEIRGLQRGCVRLAIGEGFVGDLFTEAMHAFLTRYSAIDLDVRVTGTNQVLSMVEEDEVHIGMVFDCPTLPRISIKHSYSLPLKAVMSPDNPLAQSEMVGLPDLASSKFALPPPNFRIREVIERAAFDEKIALAPAMISNSLLILKNRVMAPDCVTVLPDFAILKELKAGHLVSVPIRSKSLSNTSAGIVTRLGRLLPLSAQAFLSNLRGSFQRELG
ncbi:LysR family transcriptional regulator [Pacificimonas sp. WHA3]|uniref:LysR family transcriptional regulator n=1 Tax=Pacificimonas pallii TaxID=2827236 RepID=A0ABS6SGV5_9SPHN|nr:LysR family transcriptional regulator [Pacificimonas pallii]MBV7257490.1 LysR family transcriptional regulator [Pacificimonas pallii]